MRFLQLQRGLLQWGFKLILGWLEEVQTLGLTASDGKTAPDRRAALLKARLRHPSGKTL